MAMGFFSPLKDPPDVIGTEFWSSLDNNSSGQPTGFKTQLNKTVGPESMDKQSESPPTQIRSIKEKVSCMCFFYSHYHYLFHVMTIPENNFVMGLPKFYAKLPQELCFVSLRVQGVGQTWQIDEFIKRQKGKKRCGRITPLKHVCGAIWFYFSKRALKLLSHEKGFHLDAVCENICKNFEYR